MANRKRRAATTHALRGVVLAAALLGGYAVQSQAQSPASDYPNRRVRLIVPTSTGAGTDFTARFFAQIAGETWKQAVVVDNRSGASGMIGLDILANAAPDGYTLGFMSVSQFVDATLSNKYVFDARKDFTPISNLASTPLILVANPSANIKSLKELIAVAKNHPREMNYSSGGTGGITHLAMEFFLKRAGVQIVHVPYKGSGPAVSDLLAGHVELTFSTPATVMPYVRAGSLRAIALATDRPSQLAPGVLTFAEQGLPGVSLGTWYGLFGPANMPPEIVEKIARSLTAAAGARVERDKMERDGLDPILSTPAEFTTLLKQEHDRWTGVARDIGFKRE
jgi:tripartite-type tricarboxylate transporter receptor subunit TctC